MQTLNSKINQLFVNCLSTSSSDSSNLRMVTHEETIARFAINEGKSKYFE
jgi:hypothetical protein